MKKKFNMIILIIISAIVSSLCHATANYNESGNYDSYFHLGQGVFNLVMDDTDDNTRPLNSPKYSPLVSDLDGDGTNEIIVVDDDTVKLFHDKELDIVDSYTFSQGSGYYSNPIIFDIDADGKNEFIMALTAADMMYILEYNGSSFFNDSSYAVTFPDADSVGMIKCGHAEDCMLVYTRTSPTTGIYGRKFNSSSESATLTTISVDSGEYFCLPNFRSMAYADFDNDGISEYIGSVAELGNDDEIHVFFLTTEGTSSPTKDLEINIPDLYDASGYSCITYNRGRILTSPLVFDIDGSASNGLETAIGYMKDNNEYVIRTYKSTGSQSQRYPSIQDADGEIVSNLFRSNAMGGSTNSEVCAIGYQKTLQQLDVLCGSEQESFGIYDNLEFFYSIAGKYNVTTEFDNYNMQTHAVTMSQADETDIDEIINSYGVFDLDYDSCSSLTGFCDMNLIFENPHTDGAVISCDVEKFGLEDILVLQDTNLWYIDDQRTNEPPSLDSLEFNPCITDSILKINTTLRVIVTASDNNPDFLGDDDVSINISIYEGSANEWSENVLNVTSGSSVPFNFVLNKTISAGNIVVDVWDSYNAEHELTDIIFTVGMNGLEYGDTECTLTYGETAAAAAAEGALPDEFTVGETSSDNAIHSAMNQASSLTHLGYDVLWFTIMILMAYAIISSAPNVYGVGVTIFVEILMLIIGTLLDFVPVGIITVISVIGIISVSLIFRQFMMGTGK